MYKVECVQNTQNSSYKYHNMDTGSVMVFTLLW